MRYFLLFFLLLPAPAAWPCATAATCQFNLLDSTASSSSFGSLQDGGSITAANTITKAQWDASLDAAPLAWDETYNATTNSATPDTASLSPGNNGWRSQSTITGTFISGSWNWSMVIVHVNISGTTGAVTYAPCIRLWRSTSATGASATQIGSQSCATATQVTVTNTQTTYTGTISPGSNITLSGEYLFMQVEYNFTANVVGNRIVQKVVRVDSTLSNVVTPTFYTVPGAPSGLAVTGVTQTSVSLSWSTVTGATDYKVLRGTSPGTHGTTVTSTTGNAITYTDNTPSPCTSYYYVTHATNPAGESGDSNEVNGITNCSATNRTLLGAGN